MPRVWREGGNATRVTLRPLTASARENLGWCSAHPRGRTGMDWMLSESCPCTLALVFGSEVSTAAWLRLIVNN